MSAHAGPAVVERCACGTAHRTEATWAKCAAKRSVEDVGTADTPAAALVTAADLRCVLARWDGALDRIVTEIGSALIVVPRWCARDLIVDRDDILSMLSHYGSLAAAAAVLTETLAWEVEHA